MSDSKLDCLHFIGLPQHYSKPNVKKRKAPLREGSETNIKKPNLADEASLEVDAEIQEEEEESFVEVEAKIQLPDISWRYVRAKGINDFPSKLVFYFMNDIDVPGVGYTLYKYVKLDFIAKTVEFQVFSKPIVSSISFITKESDPFDNLEPVLQKFDRAAACKAIPDDKFEILSRFPISGGTFQSGIWRSNT